MTGVSIGAQSWMTIKTCLGNPPADGRLAGAGCRQKRDRASPIAGRNAGESARMTCSMPRIGHPDLMISSTHSMTVTAYPGVMLTRVNAAGPIALIWAWHKITSLGALEEWRIWTYVECFTV